MTTLDSLTDGSPRWAAVLERLTSIWRAAGLTLLWCLSCLPVVTAGAATVALVAVARDDVRGRERPVFRSYLHYLRENFRMGTVLLVLGVAPPVALFLTWNLRDVPAIWPVWMLALIGTAAALPLTVHGFPLAAHSRHRSVRDFYRASVLLTLTCPGATLIGLALITISAVAVAVWPGTLLLLAYPVARALFVTFRSAFEKTSRLGRQREGTSHGTH